ncbi:MAG TPA: prephenate dehydrogenase/arogenate dehydrogenase family protein [Candidatus Limnocylindria bacterium]|nr:prephenate dehydrogenase/arogenate dehydrogenase family protein [Candidatus Limnocylindria bacterium]
MNDRAAAAASLPDRIAFLGFGLIGGSIALAIREAGYRGWISAWTPGGRGPLEGRERGIVDDHAVAAEDAIQAAALVILAGPPLATLAAVADPRLPGSGALITDVASTKARIVEAANASSLRFVGGHPMAGRETTGFGSATADLFVDRPWVVVPGARASTDDAGTVDALAAATGARPIRLDAVAHDHAVAAISHLPLVLSAALVEAVAGKGARDWPLARALAAGGWRDMSRLARGDVEMGEGILATNAAAVASRLRDVRAVVDRWIVDLDGPPSDEALRERLQAARDALERE